MTLSGTVKIVGLTSAQQVLIPLLVDDPLRVEIIKEFWYYNLNSLNPSFSG